MKQKGPDFSMRLGERKQLWLSAMKKDGFASLATWIRWVVEKYLKG